MCRAAPCLSTLVACLVVLSAGLAQQSKEKKPARKPPPVYDSGILWQEPRVVDPGPAGGPPADAVVLFDGKDLSAWKGGDKWEIADGAAVAKGGAISTREAFGDCQLHVEFATPTEIKGKGQQRGNNGVKLMDRYEVQILDSFENPTYLDGMCAALYKQRPPLVNACKRPGEWQTLDIIFIVPRFDDAGKLVKPAFLTVLHNGLLVHNHVEVLGATAYDRPPAYKAHPPRGPITLAYHGNPVRFRNLWIREIQELEGKKKAD